MIKVVWLGTPQLESQNISKLLKALGYTPYEMLDTLRHDNHIEEWRAALLGQKKLDLSFLGDYDAVLLTPSSIFYQEFLKANRNVKFIYEDLDSLIAYKRYNRIRKLIQLNSYWANLFAKTRRIAKFAQLDLRQAVKGNHNSLDFQIFHKQQLNEYKNNIPEHQLLIFSSQEGWQPICNFLRKPIPKIKFPISPSQQKVSINQNIWELAVSNLRENLILIILYFLTLISIFTYLIFFY